MDWLWPLFESHVQRECQGERSQTVLRDAFLNTLSASTATLYAMEPVGETIRFKGLGRWCLADVPGLLADPNGFIADMCGGGKFKVNFHHGATFVATHNFRTYGEPRWQELKELRFEA